MLPETFALFVVILSVQGIEPECSRFHYEEQTLEKMIRQEIRMAKMEAERGETKKQVESALEAFKEEIRTEMEEMKKAQNLEKEKHIRELEDVKGKMLIPDIAFQAKVVKNRTLTDGETLVFTNTVFDFGNGYNNQTGLFTATKSGLYLFSLHLCINSNDGYMFYEVFAQERSFLNGRFVAAGGKYVPCWSSQVLINMQRGETVGVKRKSSSFLSGTSVINETPGSTESVFSGVLI